MRAAHPYAAFPIERLEAAVRAVPLDSYPVVERELADFGRAYRFWCAAVLNLFWLRTSSGAEMAWVCDVVKPSTAHTLRPCELSSLAWITGLYPARPLTRCYLSGVAALSSGVCRSRMPGLD
jgi:hypothetical protein